ncbi:MAG TPA: hypothetical protein PLC98_08460 [Anaerolineales bacterium]|nr:hypothetical protein [Anaerolineales bacterium]
MRFNLIGVAMLGLSAVVALVGGLILRLPNAPVMIAVGGTLLVIDLIWRARSFGTSGWLTNGTYGGSLTVLPIWVVGLIVMAINAVQLMF